MIVGSAGISAYAKIKRLDVVDQDYFITEAKLKSYESKLASL
jgi:hypothetical protein